MRKKLVAGILVSILLASCRGKELAVKMVMPAEVEAGTAVMVEITGNGFSSGTQVWFGQEASPQVLFISRQKLIALSPRRLPEGSWDVKVETPEGKTAVLPAGLKVERQLKLEAVEPGYVQAGKPGAKVELRGEGFGAGVEVFFAGIASPAVEVKNDRQLTALVPSLTPGMVIVTVENPNGARAELTEGLKVLAPEEKLPPRAWKSAAKEYGFEINQDGQKQTSAAAVADVNQDGFLDLAVISRSSIHLWLQTPEGKFNLLGEDAGLTSKSSLLGGYFGDFDQDGFPDLLVTGSAVKLFHNLGGRKFEDVSDRVGIPAYFQSLCAVWLDYDRDGLLDLFVGSPFGENVFFRNAGGRFERVFDELFNLKPEAERLGNTQPTAFSAASADFDRDGWPDLFVGVRGQPSVLYRNEGGKSWKPVTAEMGIITDIPGPGEKRFYKLDWGSAWGDYNNDRWPDLFTTSINMSPDLYLNQEGKSFLLATPRMRVAFTADPLAVAWGDIDNDGWLDLAVGDNGVGVRVYHNRGDGSFQDISADLGLEDAELHSNQSLVFVDFNRDGALDLYTVQYIHSSCFYLNSPYPGRHFLEVELKGATANSMAIGGVVTAEFGNTVLLRWVSGGEGYLSQPMPVVHFGLGGATMVERLTIYWPDGKEQALEKVAADQVLVVSQEGERQPVALPSPPEAESGSTAEKKPPQSPAPLSESGGTQPAAPDEGVSRPEATGEKK